MTELGRIAATPDGIQIRLERSLDHPIDTVWAALTEPEQLKVWLMEVSVLNLQVGGDIGFSEDGMGPPGIITELDPPNVIAYTWTTGHPPPPSTVRFELEATTSGTLLRLTHTRNPTAAAAHDHAAGWHAHLDWLEAQLDHGELVDFWDRFNQLRTRYVERFPVAG